MLKHFHAWIVKVFADGVCAFSDGNLVINPQRKKFPSENTQFFFSLFLGVNQQGDIFTTCIKMTYQLLGIHNLQFYKRCNNW